MSLILFIIFFSISACLILIVNYYRKLFSVSQNSFKKDEIINIQNIIRSEFSALLGAHQASGYIVIAIGCTLGFIINHMGGLYGAYYESYFFNSIAVPGITAMAIPYLRDNFYQEIQEVSFIQKIFSQDVLFLYSISVTIMTQIMVTFGVYHSINFLWVILNYVGILLLVIYYIYSKDREVTLERPEQNE